VSRPRLLDLFCKAGGATRGYQDAGFYVVGVDIEPQPNYVGDEFVQADALEYLARPSWWWPFEAVHASPPCQAFSTLRHRTGGDYPDLIEATRQRLVASGLPYVIENVVGAPLENPVTLCGSMFGLGANGRQLRRHRQFESNVPIMALQCQHHGQPVGVYGTGGGGQMTRGYKGTPEEYREAMGIGWATRAEIAEAIPPAYAEYVGEYLMAAVTLRAAA
jgi:DNA (cytosine-5)-methyltransferase 1